MTKATFTGDGSTSRFSFSFPYVLDSDVRVSVDGVDLLTSQYALFGTSEMDITDGAAVTAANGLEIAVYRYSGGDIPNTTFQPGPVRSKDLNEAIQQAAFIAEEGRATADAAALVADNADTNADIAIAAIAAFSGGGTTSLVSASTQLTFAPVADTKVAYIEDEGKFYVLYNTGYASFVDVALAKTWYKVSDDFIGDLEASNNLSEVDPAATRINLNVPGFDNAVNTFSGRMEIDGLVRMGNPDIDAHLGATAPALVAASPASVSAGLSWTPIDSVELYVVRNGDVAVDIVSNTASSSIINFSTQVDEDAMQIDADHATDTMIFRIAGAAEMTMGVNGLTVHGAIGANTVTGNWVASLAEAQAGTVINKVMTPERVADAITAQVVDTDKWAIVDQQTSAAQITEHSGVSGIADNGTGIFTLTFASAFADVNYNVQGTATGFSAGNGTLICNIVGAKATGPAVKTTTTLQMSVTATDSLEHDCLETYVFCTR